MTSLKARMTQGNIVSWATGIFLGLILGVALLIVTNAGAPAGGGSEAAAEAGVTETTTAESATTAAQAGNTAETASAASGPATDSMTGESQETAATVGDPATTAGGDATAANAAAGEAAAGDATAGGEKFASSCGGCHGAQGEGGLGPAMTANAKNWDLAGFTTTLREGKTPDGRELAPTMPRFAEGQLSDADVANIHAWVQGL